MWRRLGPIALPLVAGAANAVPPPAAVAAPADTAATSSARAVVLFAAAEATLPRQAGRTLDPIIARLRAEPRETAVIEGHCDERGSAERNVVLGERRARAVMAYLVARGIPRMRIALASYGSTRPRCTGADPGCQQKNRRVEVRIADGIWNARGGVPGRD
jgi:peptidoglycan-associated lipoprotein